MCVMTKPKFPLLAGRWLDLPSKISKSLLVMGAVGIILVVWGSPFGRSEDLALGFSGPDGLPRRILVLLAMTECVHLVIARAQAVAIH